MSVDSCDAAVDRIPRPPPAPSDKLHVQSRAFNTARPTFEPVRLHFAINQEDLESAEEQVRRGIDINFIVHGNTPLMLATLRRQFDIVNMLIRAGADVTIPEIYAWKRQPIHIAAMLDQVDIVAAMLDAGASVQAADGMRMTPLHWAAAHGSLATVQLLLDHDCHLEARDDRGKTALCRAAAGSHTSVVTTLRDLGAAVNIQDVHGWSPLHHAVFCSLPISTCSLQLGANPNLRDHRGNTVLHLMTRRTDYDNLRILASADLQYYTRDRKLTSSCTQGITAFLDDKDLLLSLIDYGLDLNMRNAEGYTAMDLAARSGSCTFIQWLVQAGADISLPICSYPEGWPQPLLDDPQMCQDLCQIGTQRKNLLKDLCKNSIRRYLYPAISVSICQLPLPRQLKNYLQLEIL